MDDVYILKPALPSEESWNFATSSNISFGGRKHCTKVRVGLRVMVLGNRFSLKYLSNSYCLPEGRIFPQHQDG